MQRPYGTMRIIGLADPVALADRFTDVYLLECHDLAAVADRDEIRNRLLQLPQP